MTFLSTLETRAATSCDGGGGGSIRRLSGFSEAALLLLLLFLPCEALASLECSGVSSLFDYFDEFLFLSLPFRRRSDGDAAALGGGGE